METVAREAILMDANTGAVLLEKNADQPMPPASMSKLMTIYLVFEQLNSGKLKLEDSLPVSEKAWRMGGSKMFVKVHSTVTVHDLLRGVIVQSGNDACVVLAEGLAGSEEAFAERMNRKAKELGLDGSVFANSTGWPHPEQRMTARDLALLSIHLVKDFPQYYPIFAELTFTYNDIKQGNRNPLLYRNIGADGLKTGHTEESGYGLTASVIRNGRRLVLVVNGLKSMQSRADEPARLIEWGFRTFDNYALFKAGETIEEAPVWLGDQKTVPVVPARPVTLTLSRQARRDMTVKLVYDSPIPAPIRKGDTIGKVVITAPEQKPIEIPVLAAAAVDRLGVFGRLGAALNHVLWGPSS